MTLSFNRCFLLATVIAVLGPVAPTAVQTTSTIKFGASSYVAQESAGGVQVTVTRSGDTAGGVTVDYATSSGTASERTDFIPALGTLRFASGETTKTFTVLINDNNRTRRFHLEPGSIGFADLTIEVCDTWVMGVENSLEAVGGSFLPGNIMCPWASRIVREVPPPPR